MGAVAKAARLRRDKSARKMEIAERTARGIFGAFLSILGIVLAAGGLMSAYDGSAAYAVWGLGLAIAGALIAKRNRAGAWTYLAVFAVTVSWSLSNVEPGPSLGHRLIGPILLLVLLAALLPMLSKWRPRHAAIALAALVVLTAGLGLSSAVRPGQAAQVTPMQKSVSSTDNSIDTGRD